MNPDVRPSGEVRNMSGNLYTILYSKFKRLLGVVVVKAAGWILHWEGTEEFKPPVSFLQMSF